MSLLNGQVIISVSGGATLFPAYAYQAVTKSYEPGDCIGYGRTPQEAEQDLYDLIHLHISSADAANPQYQPS